jgi:hypothetical protein
MLEFTLDGNDYRAGKLDAFQQLHVSRKLAAVLPKAVPGLLAMAGSAEDAANDLGSLVAAFAPAGEALAAMPEADVDFVFHTCLAVVQRRNATGRAETWSAIWNGAARRLMFEDIGLDAMTQIVFRVIGDSLGNFTRGLLAKLPQQATGPKISAGQD